jgi:hypothetical protein
MLGRGAVVVDGGGTELEEIEALAVTGIIGAALGAGGCGAVL